MRLSQKDLRAMTGEQLLNNLAVDLCAQARLGTVALVCYEQVLPVSPKLKHELRWHKRSENMFKEEILRRLALTEKDRPRVKRV